MEVSEFPHCCGAKIIHDLPLRYPMIPQPRIDKAALKKDLTAARAKAKRMGYPDQAFYIIALNQRQYECEDIREAVEEAKYELLKAGIGSHGTPVYLYVSTDDPVEVEDGEGD